MGNPDGDCCRHSLHILGILTCLPRTFAKLNRPTENPIEKAVRQLAIQVNRHPRVRGLIRAAPASIKTFLLRAVLLHPNIEESPDPLRAMPASTVKRHGPSVMATSRARGVRHESRTLSASTRFTSSTRRKSWSSKSGSLGPRTI